MIYELLPFFILAEREVYEPLYLSYCNSVIYHSIDPHGVRIRKSTKKITF